MASLCALLCFPRRLPDSATPTIDYLPPVFRSCDYANGVLVMITRAQAEALLTLAESLEACERLGVELVGTDVGNYVNYGESLNAAFDVDDFYAMSIRLAVNALIPKQET